ncbi:site-specific recombinase, phage integrase family [Escherichia coli DEC12D]|nr:site-specific recombinase, phage integrase family [Escherichia coli DEC12D]
MPDGRTEVIGDQRVGFYRNALDRSEGAQQNEGSHIPAYTGSNTAVHHAAGGAEQAHGLIAGGSETGGQRIAVWKISAQEA